MWREKLKIITVDSSIKWNLAKKHNFELDFGSFKYSFEQFFRIWKDEYHWNLFFKVRMINIINKNCWNLLFKLSFFHQQFVQMFLFHNEIVQFNFDWMSNILEEFNSLQIKSSFSDSGKLKMI
jgi:hypothetical protein